MIAVVVQILYHVRRLARTCAIWTQYTNCVRYNIDNVKKSCRFRKVLYSVVSAKMSRLLFRA